LQPTVTVTLPDGKLATSTDYQWQVVNSSGNYSLLDLKQFIIRE
jgi:hypothetical protein